MRHLRDHRRERDMIEFPGLLTLLIYGAVLLALAVALLNLTPA